MRAGVHGPAPPKASSMKSRRSWPRMVEIALIASSIFTSMMRTMPSAASTDAHAERLRDLASRPRVRALPASSRILPPRKLSSLRWPSTRLQSVMVGIVAAARVAGRARHRAGALRADLQHAEAVDARDGAAAGAHRVDVHHRHRDVAAFDLAAARDERLAVLDQRDVAGGAAHVEGDDVLEAGHAARIGAGGDAAGRAREHRGHRLARRGGEGRHAAVRLHDVFLPRRRGRPR